MKKKTAINISIGAISSLLLVDFPGGALIGGSLAGYLQRGSRKKNIIVGLLTGLVAILLLWIITISNELLQGEIRYWWALVQPLITASLYAIVISPLGGAIGGYVREETSE
ncbi:DUF5518 domain-containing protein [Halorussus caseinilyticus]|uniref:DUF5518 domain-containing protein n=1 Tax=Halorussus caseinilyticus TaxID=3034025 RepID=A0ABD5WL85_9EURY|nr:DUF5518 domain-containing protein [Halorussus sp. DT72]